MIAWDRMAFLSLHSVAHPSVQDGELRGNGAGIRPSAGGMGATSSRGGALGRGSSGLALRASLLRGSGAGWAFREGRGGAQSRSPPVSVSCPPQFLWSVAKVGCWARLLAPEVVGLPAQDGVVGGVTKPRPLLS